jgi:hypothetical protein
MVESEETSIARQRLGKHVPAATNMQAIIEVSLETTFSIRSMQSGYKRSRSRVEAGSLWFWTKAVVVGGDEKRRLKSERVKYGRESLGTRPEKDCAGIYKDKPVLSSERAHQNKKTETGKQK